MWFVSDLHEIGSCANERVRPARAGHVPGKQVRPQPKQNCRLAKKIRTMWCCRNFRAEGAQKYGPGRVSSYRQQQKQIEVLTAMVQKVSDQLELSKPAPQIVANNQ
jgi:hypothetical protein